MRIEYQSNGGVVLWLQVRFNELGGAARAPVAFLSVAAMPLELAPLAVVGGKEMVVRQVRYRQGPAPADAIGVRRDDQGRLVLPKSSEAMLDRLADEPVVIYLEKVLP
jgi:hypothetical protein